MESHRQETKRRIDAVISDLQAAADDAGHGESCWDCDAFLEIAQRGLAQLRDEIKATKRAQAA